MTGESSDTPRDAALRGFADELNALLNTVGRPSLAELVRISESKDGVRLSRSTVSDKLGGRSAPSWEFVVTFVNACRIHAEELSLPIDGADFDLARWHDLHTELLRELAKEHEEAPARSPGDDAGGQTGPPAFPLPGLPPFLADLHGDIAALISTLRDAASRDEVVPLLVVSGAQGSGKTFWATAIAHHLADAFPDGVHFVNLARLHPESERVAAVLDGLLRTLGVEAGDIPETVTERSASLRSLLASRRLLIVLDDVSDPRLVESLLPEDDGRSLLVVTSPRTFGAPRSLFLELGGLSQEDGRELLELSAGRERVAREPDAAAELIEVCGDSPLALCLAAAFLDTNPNWSVADLVARLREPMTVGGPVSSLLAQLYVRLSEPAAMVLRRLSLVDEHEEIPRRLVPFLVTGALSAEDADQAIDRLVDVHLLYTWQDGQVIRMHDVVREHARERAEAEETAAELTAVRDRARRFFHMARGHRPQPEPMIARDYWTLRDRLSYSHYADAIAEFVRHRQTRPPLTIGLKAPWGAGKTSLMRMIQNNLDPRDGERPCGIRLDRGDADPSRRRWSRMFRRRKAAPEARMTNLDILRETGPDDVTPEPAARLRARLAEDAPVRAGDWRPTVWFNPWMYQNGEQIWAGLAHEIITQVTERLPVRDRERFWLRLNLARIDRSVIRRRWYRLLAERLLPFLAVWVVAFLITLAWLVVGQLIDPLRGPLRGVSAAVLGTGTIALIAGGAGQTLSFLGKAATGPLSALVRKPDILGGGHRLLGDQMKTGFDKIVPDPGYAGRLGFLHLVHSDMKRVLDLIATPERPLVVFVDDLDRCSPSAVTQVIEAVNLFLAGEFPNCVFVLGMEPGAVAAHVEVAYQDLVKAQRDGRLAGDWSTLGWRFLEKIVQLPLSIPAPGVDGEIGDYVRSLIDARPDEPRPALDGGRPPAGESRPRPEGAILTPRQARSRGLPTPGPAPFDSLPVRPEPDDLDEIERLIRARQPTPDTLREIALAVQQERLDLPEPLHPTTLAAADRVVSDLYSDLDAHSVLADSLPVLASRNPREIKRFVNLFRFYSFVAERQRLLGAPAPDQTQVAKLAAFSIRWPHVVSMLGSAADTDHPLARLERAARDGDRSRWDAELRGIFPVFDVPADQPPDTPSPILPPGWGDDLRTFLREGAEIGTVAARFI